MSFFQVQPTQQLQTLSLAPQPPTIQLLQPAQQFQTIQQPQQVQQPSQQLQTVHTVQQTQPVVQQIQPTVDTINSILQKSNKQFQQELTEQINNTLLNNYNQQQLNITEQINSIIQNKHQKFQEDLGIKIDAYFQTVRKNIFDQVNNIIAERQERSQNNVIKLVKSKYDNLEEDLAAKLNNLKHRILDLEQSTRSRQVTATAPVNQDKPGISTSKRTEITDLTSGHHKKQKLAEGFQSKSMLMTKILETTEAPYSLTDLDRLVILKKIHEHMTTAQRQFFSQDKDMQISIHSNDWQDDIYDFRLEAERGSKSSVKNGKHTITPFQKFQELFKEDHPLWRDTEIGENSIFYRLSKITDFDELEGEIQNLMVETQKKHLFLSVNKHQFRNWNRKSLGYFKNLQVEEGRLLHVSNFLNEASRRPMCYTKKNNETSPYPRTVLVLQFDKVPDISRLLSANDEERMQGVQLARATEYPYSMGLTLKRFLTSRLENNIPCKANANFQNDGFCSCATAFVFRNKRDTAAININSKRCYNYSRSRKQLQNVSSEEQDSLHMLSFVAAAGTSKRLQFNDEETKSPSNTN